MTEFYVKVETECREFKLEKSGFMYRVCLTEPAENGKANAELVRELENILDKRPAIVSGHKSRRKKLKLDIPEKELRRKLEYEF